MGKIVNPVLTGFHPDPSIVRVGEDYYIAVSTFEWFPGVLIYHSLDLVHWELKAAPLNRVSQLDLKGVDSSEGVWAPCLSFSGGLFYLIYTVVRRWGYGGPRDLHNYLVTAPCVEGEWSEPVPLNSTGFDPSLFHDEDGRKWLLNMCWDHRPGHPDFSGILLQEYDAEKQRLVGKAVKIFEGTSLGLTEGPHLYKKDGFYYLLTAEGGTGFSHCVTLARSRNIEGPYEVHPDNPVLTSRHNPKLTLQKAGHGSLVETGAGDWYLAHLCARPLPSRGRCILGRETAIQKVEWKDGWLYLPDGSREPKETAEVSGLPEKEWEKRPEKDEFTKKELPLYYQSLRVPMEESWITLKERPGFLRLYGRESLSSRFEQSLIARRQQDFCYEAETALEFEPEHFNHMAGLVVMYDIKNFYYLHMTWEEERGRVVTLTVCRKGVYEGFPALTVSHGEGKRCYLRAKMHYHELFLFYSPDGTNWKQLGECFDSSVLSDDYMEPLHFTGAFVGICCQDLSGGRKYADFDYFSYKAL